jgi:hypothetical protein
MRQNEKRLNGTGAAEEMTVIPGVGFSLEPVRNPAQGQPYDNLIEGGFPVRVRVNGDDAKVLTVTDGRMRSILGGFNKLELVGAMGRWRVTVYETSADKIEGNPEEGPRLHDLTRGHAPIVLAAGLYETFNGNDPYRIVPFSVNERGVLALGEHTDELGNVTATRLATENDGRILTSPGTARLIAEYPSASNASEWSAANFTAEKHYIYGPGVISDGLLPMPLDVRRYSLLVATIEGGWTGDGGDVLSPWLKFTTSEEATASVVKTQLCDDPAETFQDADSCGYIMVGAGVSGDGALPMRFPYVHFGYEVTGTITAGGPNLKLRLWGYP